MKAYIVAPEAEQDVFQIWRYVFHRASPGVANRVEAALYKAFEPLSATPGQGHTRADLTAHSVLFFSVYSYMIVDRATDPLEIVRVLTSGERAAL